MLHSMLDDSKSSLLIVGRADLWMEVTTRCNRCSVPQKTSAGREPPCSHCTGSVPHMVGCRLCDACDLDYSLPVKTGRVWA